MKRSENPIIITDEQFEKMPEFIKVMLDKQTNYIVQDLKGKPVNGNFESFFKNIDFTVNIVAVIEKILQHYMSLDKTLKGSTELNLQNNGINDETAVKIFEVLKDYMPIINVGMSENPITDKGVEAIFEMLRSNKNIKHLHMSDILSPPSYLCGAIMNLLKHNTSLFSIEVLETIDENQDDTIIKNAFEQNKLYSLLFYSKYAQKMKYLLEVANDEKCSFETKTKEFDKIDSMTFEIYQLAHNDQVPAIEDYIGRNYFKLINVCKTFTPAGITLNQDVIKHIAYFVGNHNLSIAGYNAKFIQRYKELGYENTPVNQAPDTDADDSMEDFEIGYNDTEKYSSDSEDSFNETINIVGNNPEFPTE